MSELIHSEDSPESVRHFVVEPEDAGQRLDRWLAGRLCDSSRSAIQKWIDAGRVLAEGRPARANQRLAAGQSVRVSIPAQPRLTLVAEKVPLEVVYEDRHLLVINKPAGMVVHPAPGHTSGTLVNALLGRYPELAGLAADQYQAEADGSSSESVNATLDLDEEEDEGGASADSLPRPGIVHRLDKDTSGLIIVARTPAAGRALKMAFKSRVVHKTYLALVHGAPTPPEGSICAPLGRDPRRRKRMAVLPQGRVAETIYRVRQTFGDYALLEASPLTGRTHQIRVHLASIRHPIVGDQVYGRRKPALDCPRHFLHAWRLGLDHPVTGERLEMEAPLPADLEAVLDLLRTSNPAAGEEHTPG